LELPYDKTQHTRPNPADKSEACALTPHEMKHSAALMRINHTGEICAQALYLGQSITARNHELRNNFTTAAQEESDHLSWCEQRITELGSHKSYLNPLWFTGSLLIGTCAGIVGDKWSLGFLAQTEQKVYEHLGAHLEKLPKTDYKSRAIVSVMQQEEAAHAKMAIDYGAQELPTVIKIGMQFLAKVMTNVVYYV
jgi:ubiquinone biosynthesis monooxygenase Coq7